MKPSDYESEVAQIGERFRLYLHKNKINLSQAAIMIDTSPPSVKNITLGKNFTVKRLLQMIDVFDGLTIEYLFGTNNNDTFVKEEDVSYKTFSLQERVEELEREVKLLKKALL